MHFNSLCTCAAYAAFPDPAIRGWQYAWSPGLEELGEKLLGEFAVPKNEAVGGREESCSAQRHPIYLQTIPTATGAEICTGTMGRSTLAEQISLYWLQSAER